MGLSVLALEQSILSGWDFNPVHTHHLGRVSCRQRMSQTTHLRVDHETKSIGNITLKGSHLCVEQVVEPNLSSLEETWRIDVVRLKSLSYKGRQGNLSRTLGKLLWSERVILMKLTQSSPL